MIMLVEVISVLEKQLLRFYYVDFIGLIFFMLHLHIAQHVSNAKD